MKGQDAASGMIHARLSSNGDCIIVTADPEAAPVVAKLPGVTRSAKMLPFTWRMALNSESIAQLRRVGARADRTLIDIAKRIITIRKFIEKQKALSEVEPIAMIPLKPGVVMYAHQIKGYNIVLSLFGYPMRGGDAL